MITCHYCGKQILSQMYWSRFDGDEHRIVPVCNECAAEHVDEYHHWNLVYEFNDEYKED